MAVPVCAAIFMLLILAGTSVVAMVQRGADRVEQRTALLAEKPSPTDLTLLYGDDFWRGEQFLVVFIEPSGSGESVLPPGMERLPRPGQAVVSPALDREASLHLSLAKRYPNRAVLGTEGVYNGDELFAYVRVQKGRSLPGDLVRDLGDSGGVRARAFGVPSGADVPFGLEPLSQMPLASQVAAGVLGFLVVPGVIVLAVGLATASRIRDGRFEILHRIGVSGPMLMMLAVLETLMLAAPGLVASTVFWGFVSPRLQQVPLVGHDAVRGDLGLPIWLLLVQLAVCVALTGFVATVVTVGAAARRRQSLRPRPLKGRAVLSLLRAAPLVLALVLLALGVPVRGVAGSLLNLFGIVAVISGVPLAFPGVLRFIGKALGQLRSVPPSVAGRGLEWDPMRAARPFLGVAALLIVVLAGTGYIALASGSEENQSAEATMQAVFVEWPDPHREDSERFDAALSNGLAVPFFEGTPDQGKESGMRIGTTCRQLAALLDAKCDPEAPYVLPSEARTRLTGAVGSVVSSPGSELRLVPPDEVAASGSALVLGNAPPGVLETQVREAAMQTLPAPYVYSQSSFELNESPLVAWIAGGIVASAIALAVGSLISLIDRLLGVHHHRRHLLNLGVSPRRLAAIEAWLFAAPYGSVMTVSFVAGVVICVLIVGIFPEDSVMPWRGIILTLGIGIVIGLIGTVAVAFFGARSVRENVE